MLGVEEDVRVLGISGGGKRTRRLRARETAWLAVLFEATSSFCTKPLLVGGRKEDWWYHCGSVSQLLPTEQGTRLREMLIIC